MVLIQVKKLIYLFKPPRSQKTYKTRSDEINIVAWFNTELKMKTMRDHT